jgi:RNA polymerase sigma factor (sigma-70 family)
LEEKSLNRYAKSDYALNRKSDGIVYSFADGRKEVTLADFLAENPNAATGDFTALKALSDTDYLERERRCYNTTRKDVNLDWAEQAGKCSAASPEDAALAVIDAQDEAERKSRRIQLARQGLDKLTDIQRRRYLLHFYDGLTGSEIAEIEGTTKQAVSLSLQQAEKNLKKFLRKCTKTT